MMPRGTPTPTPIFVAVEEDDDGEDEDDVVATGDEGSVDEEGSEVP